ncbi:hypothetical protein BR93DRAFT_906008 [Coniochaeta sp. PMI_546]|nr:hypothetical protein BR93DRAFT_906008 [Coniochaeta sp. PMI_546]
MAYFLNLILFGSVVWAACNEAVLHLTTQRYIAAQSLGNVKYMFLTEGITTYLENDRLTNISAGILSQRLKIDHSESIYDATTCATYTELVVTDANHPYVIGTQQRLTDNGTVAHIETLVTDVGDWLFNAAHVLYYRLREKRAVIAVDKRDSREVLQAAADSYFDAFRNGNGSSVPWGAPCSRIEGGLNTATNGSCNSGVPSGVDIVDRRYVIDQAMGTVSSFVAFGSSRLPDSHEFRIERGKIVGVHTITVCADEPMCGFELSGELKAALEADLGLGYE